MSTELGVETKTTSYAVMVTVGRAGADGPLAPESWPLELWREVTVLQVPQRTNRAAVVEQAKDLVGELLGEGHETVRLRIVPVVEVTEAVVGLESQPRLTATIVTPEAASA
jgi:hypothetical protein